MSINMNDEIKTTDTSTTTTTTGKVHGEDKKTLEESKEEEDEKFGRLFQMLSSISTQLGEIDEKIVKPVEVAKSSKEEPKWYHGCGVNAANCLLIAALVLTLILFFVEIYSGKTVSPCDDNRAVVQFNRFFELLSNYTSIAIDIIVYSSFLYNWRAIFYAVD